MGKKAKPAGKPLMSFDAFFAPKPSPPPIVEQPKELPQIKAAPAPRVQPQHVDQPKPRPAKPTGGITDASKNLTRAETKKTTLMQATGSKPVPPKISRTPRHQPGEYHVDLSGYKAPDTINNILDDGFVYYCRDCKKHFKGPIFIENSFGNVDSARFWETKLCPSCNSALIHVTGNTDASDDNCCEVCGVKLGTKLGKKYTDQPICLSCNSEFLTDLMKKEHAKHEHMPFADNWIYGKLVDHYSNPNDPNHYIQEGELLKTS